MEFIFFEMALVLSAVRPLVNAQAVEFVLVPEANVFHASGDGMWSYVDSKAVVEALAVVTLVIRGVCSSLLSDTVLLIIEPLTKVCFSCCMNVSADTASFVVFPETSVGVTVLVGQGAETVGHIIMPLALIICATWPSMLFNAVFFTILANYCLIFGTIIIVSQKFLLLILKIFIFVRCLFWFLKLLSSRLYLF